MSEMTKEMLDNLGKYNTDGTILDLLTHIESLQVKIEELTDRIKWLEINWCNPNGEDGNG